MIIEKNYSWIGVLSLMSETTSIILTGQCNDLSDIVYILKYLKKLKNDRGWALNMLKAEKGNVCPLKADFTELILATQNVFISLFIMFFFNFIWCLIYARCYTGASTGQWSFLWWWKCSMSTLFSTAVIWHMWLLST